MQLSDSLYQRDYDNQHSPFARGKDNDYENRKRKMETNIEHHAQCVDSPERQVRKAPTNKEYKVTFDNEAEKLQNLKDENIKLKTKKRELEDSVKQIATKLKRQITQLKKDKIVGAGGNLYSKIDEELDLLIDENVKLQDEEQKLMTKVKSIQTKRKKELNQGFGQSKKLQKTFEQSHKTKSRSPQKQKMDKVELESYRNHIENGNKKIIELKNEIELLRRSVQGGIQGTVASEQLANQLRNKELQIAQARAKLEDLGDNFKVKEEIFGQNKQYQDGLLKELREMNTEFLELQKQNRALDESAKEVEYLQQKKSEILVERDKLQREFDSITRQPFFKREADQNHFKRIQDMEKQLDDKEREIKQTKTSIVKMDEEQRSLNEDFRNLKSERDTFQEEIERFKIQLDPNSLSLADIQKKIHDLDPSMFRQVMKDLKYDGEEPIWAKFDFMDRLKIGPDNQPLDDKNPTQLKREIERLKLERRDLASELQKVQNLLKIQVDIDKQNAQLYQQRINELQALIQGDNKKISEYNSLIKVRNMKLLQVQKQTGSQRLTAAGLAQIDQELNRLTQKQGIVKDEELLTEFSVVTEESEISPQENVFELIISNSNFDKQRLTQLLGNKELLATSVQTFITVDFYNHDTRHSDLSEGFEPCFNTQFSFKNAVDDFYVQYLEKNYVTVEIFLSRAQSALKLGVAKLPLSKVLDKDVSFQTQEIVHNDGESGGCYTIGRIFYKMRMRKQIDEAIKWYQQKKALREQRDPTLSMKQDINSYTNQSRKSKIFTITVLKGYDFKRQDDTYNSKNMQPFFFYQFYTFEYTSPILQGNNPIFECQKQFDVEVTEQFLEYMKTQVLKIDFIDESVEIREGQNDYIGSARIPLREVFTNEELVDNFPIKDELGRENGRIEIKLSCRDYNQYTEGVSYGKDGSNMILNKLMEQEIITGLAQALAEIPFEDIDLIFDFFNQGSDANKIYKKDFKEFVLLKLNLRSIREIDLELFLKTSFYCQNKDFIDRNDFRNMFEYSIREARNKKLEMKADINQKYSTAQSFFKTGDRTTNMNLNTQTPAYNPFLDQSINQRDQTPQFIQSTKRLDFGNTSEQQTSKPSNESNSPIKKQESLISQKSLKKSLPLFDQIKEKVYHVINKFEEIVGLSQPFATWDQFKQVMQGFTNDEDDIANFWSQYHFDNKFFYSQQLLQLSNIQLQQDPSTAQLNKVLETESNPKIQNIKGKIQEYMLKHDYSLEVIFKFLDKNKSDGISIEELTRGLKEILSEEECRILFMAVDKDHSNEISYNEIITECSRVNCAYVLYKINQHFQNSKDINPEKIFDMFETNRSGYMEIHEFNQMLNFIYEGVGKLEVDSLFKHFDKSGTGRLSKDDFKNALKQKMTLENRLQPSIHELLTPLQTKLKQINLKPEAIFDKFSKSKSTLSIADFKEILMFFLKVQLSQDEEKLLTNFIQGSYSNITLDKNNFANLLSKNYIVKSFGQGNRTIAVQTFTKIKTLLKMKKKNLQDLIKLFSDSQEIINIRNMKVFLFVNFTLPDYEIENIIDYLDKDSDGFIPIKEILKEIEFAKE